MAKFKLEDGTEVEAFTAEELQAEIQKEVAGLKAKNGELLGLHSKDKERLVELEQAAKDAEEERKKEQGEFKDLYEKTLDELEKEREDNRKFKKAIQDKDLESEAAKLVEELTRDSKRAELLKKEVLQYAKYTEDGVKFEIDGVAVEGSRLIEKMRENYPFLVDGSGASGGGAPGANLSGKAGKKFEEYTGAELSALRKAQPEEYKRLKDDYQHRKDKKEV